MLTIDFLQWAGFATGAAGSLMLALKTRHSGWGFVLFLISNGFWGAYGVETDAPGLIAAQVIFTATSLLGIHRWLFCPARNELNAIELHKAPERME